MPEEKKEKRELAKEAQRAKEPKGFKKLAGLPFTYVPIFKARIVQVGLIIGISIQTIISLLSAIYFRPQIIAFFEKFLDSQGTSSMESFAALFSLLPAILIILITPFVSSVISGYTVGKISTKLRYGIMLGISSLLLGLFSSYFINYFYSFSYSFYEILINTGNITPSEISFTDGIIGLSRTLLFLLAGAGGGGAIGQLLSLWIGKKDNQILEERDDS